MSSIIPTPDGGRIVKTNCFECHSKCGVMVHVNSSDMVVKVEGNPQDPRAQGRLCTKGRASIDVLYHPDRVNYPMKRTGKRGEGNWERISWDEAMDTIVQKIKDYREEFGPESIIFAQGTGRGINQWTHRLGVANGVNHLCSPTHVCLLPLMITQMNTIGTLAVLEGSDLDHSNCIVQWGANMSWTEAAFTAGEMNRSRDRATKMIVIDPCFEHPWAAKADLFLGVRPGGDLAIVMAWLNIIINENLYDAQFVKQWTTLPVLIDPESLTPIYEGDIVSGGNPKQMMVWDTLTDSPKPLDFKPINPVLDISGKIKIKGVNDKIIEATTAWAKLRERAEEMPPERAANLSWVDADKIVAAARMYATTKPASIVAMQGVEEHTNSRPLIHAITILIAITGNFDVKGGNVMYSFWSEMLGDYLAGLPTEYHWKYKLGNPKEGKFYPISHPKSVWEAMLTGKPYPIKAFINIQGNPLSWSENPNKVAAALKAVDFLVVMEYFLSPTAQLADIVLPSTHWLERDYIADECCQEWIYAQQRAVDPLFERRSDINFARELGNRINPEMWPWKTDEELFDYQLKPLNITWKQLQEQWVYQAYPYKEKKYLKDGFATPSKKAELYSTFFLNGGSDPLPYYVEPAETPYSRPDMAKEYPLILSSGRRCPNYYHSAYRNIPRLRELQPEPQVMVNPETGKSLGFKSGDDVWIESPRGRVKMKARLTNAVHPKVVIAPHGWWQGCKELGLSNYPDNIANINVLVSDEDYDPDLGVPGMRSLLCKVYKV